MSDDEYWEKRRYDSPPESKYYSPKGSAREYREKHQYDSPPESKHSSPIGSPLEYWEKHRYDSCPESKYSSPTGSPREERTSRRLFRKSKTSNRPRSVSASTTTGKRQPTMVEIIRAKRQMEDAYIPAYEVNYSAVEVQPRTRVCMHEEVESRNRLKKMLSSKAGVITAQIQKAESQKAREKFYGPQLQIPWGHDNDTMKGKKRAVDPARDYSPTREVKEILARRAMGLAIPSTKDRDNVVVSETANSFLRSSIASSMVLNTRQSVVIRQEKPVDKLVQLKKQSEMTDLEFIGPQLPVDWNGKDYSKRFKTAAVALDKGLGRDSKKVHTKGIVEVIEFTEVVPTENSDIGPGKYDVDAALGIGDYSKLPGAIAYDRMAGRAELVGPNGEKSDRDLVPMRDLILDAGLIDLFDSGVPDIEYGTAKDRVNKIDTKYQIFAKEVIVKAPEPNDHIGGLWFEGMAEEVLKRPATVQIAKQTGRRSSNEEKEDHKVDKEVGLTDQLDIEVKDFKPHLPSTTVHTMKDPKVYPRFPEVKPTEGFHLEYQPNKEYIEKRVLSLAKMSKQSNRFVESDANMQEENELIRDELEGAEDSNLAIEIAKETDAKKSSAIDIVGKHKRVSTVDMSRQKGREDITHSRKEIDEDNDDDQDQEREQQTAITDYTFGGGIGKGRVKGGVGSWAKEKTKDEEGDLQQDGEEQEIFQKPELHLEPKLTGLASYKPVQSGPSWSTQADKDRFPKPNLPASHDLVYENADAGNFQPGKGALGTNNTGRSFVKQSERTGANKDEEEQQLLGEELQTYQELQLSPNLMIGKRGVESSGPAWSTQKYERVITPAIPTAAAHLDFADPSRTDPGIGKAGKGPLGTNNCQGGDLSKARMAIDETLAQQLLADEIGAPELLVLDVKTSEFGNSNIRKSAISIFGGKGSVTSKQQNLSLKSGPLKSGGGPNKDIAALNPSSNPMATAATATKEIELLTTNTDISERNEDLKDNRAAMNAKGEGDNISQRRDSQTASLTESRLKQQLEEERQGKDIPAPIDTEAELSAKQRREEQRQRLQAQRQLLQQQQKELAEKKREEYLKQQQEAVAKIQQEREAQAQQEKLLQQSSQLPQQKRRSSTTTPTASATDLDIDAILSKIPDDNMRIDAIEAATNTNANSKKVSFAISPRPAASAVDGKTKAKSIVSVTSGKSATKSSKTSASAASASTDKSSKSSANKSTTSTAAKTGYNPIPPPSQKQKKSEQSYESLSSPMVIDITAPTAVGSRPPPANQSKFVAAEFANLSDDEFLRVFDAKFKV